MTSNFIAGPNPFSIARPPQWFLNDMLQFDPALVIFASQEQPCYQIARRIQGKRHAKPSDKHPDTVVFATHNLHPVGRLLPSPFTRWGPTILADLRARDVDAFGGGDKAADRLDAFDQEEEDQFFASLDDHLDYVTRDAWSYKTKQHHSRSERLAPSVPSIGRPNFRPGGSAVFVGDHHSKSPEAWRRLRSGRAAETRMNPKIVTDVSL